MPNCSFNKTKNRFSYYHLILEAEAFHQIKCQISQVICKVARDSKCYILGWLVLASRNLLELIIWWMNMLGATVLSWKKEMDKLISCILNTFDIQLAINRGWINALGRLMSSHDSSILLGSVTSYKLFKLCFRYDILRFEVSWEWYFSMGLFMSSWCLDL